MADAQHLPLPAAHADAAVSVFGIIFAADPQRALAELVRCVRPAGQVAFTTYAPADGRAELARCSPARWDQRARIIDQYLLVIGQRQ
ncbi:MAG: class I SAM-dependent methyltransferase [Actinomycetota bacterium]|nr:class I SAM-dependent methyltransferase [Actinomycetota bacterium]